MKKLQYIQPQVDIMITVMPIAIYCASTGFGGDASNLTEQQGATSENPLYGN